MSASQFSVRDLPVDRIDSGTSVLLTGEDTDALESLFYRLVATDGDQRGVVLATDSDGRTVRRTLDSIERGVGDDVTVLTPEGSATDESVTPIDSLEDLTSLGMELSTAVADVQQETEQFRTGIYLCSRIFENAEDIRSVYRFINSNFMTDLRRGDGIGVCAIDTTADIGADSDSVVAGLQTSFTGHVHVTTADGTATLEVSGLGDADGVHDVSL